MKKYFSSMFLLLVLSIQLLPLSQISTAVFESQQMTEELPHSDELIIPLFAEEIHKHIVTVTYEELIHLTEWKVTELIQYTEKLFTGHSDDVQARTPDT